MSLDEVRRALDVEAEQLDTPSVDRLASAMERVSARRTGRRQRWMAGAAVVALAGSGAYGVVRLAQDVTVRVPVRDHAGNDVGSVEAQITLDEQGRVKPFEYVVEGPTGPIRRAVILDGQYTEEEIREAMASSPVTLGHPADFVAPAGVFSFEDIEAFMRLWSLEMSQADIAEPRGVWDQADVLEYLRRFEDGRRDALAARAEGDAIDVHWPTRTDARELR